MRRRQLPVAALATLAAALLAPAAADAARPLETGVLDPLFDAADSGARAAVFDDSVQAGAGLVRIDVSWREVAGSPPADPADAADPAYDFALVDAAVRDAAQRGLRALLTLTSAPRFAEGPGRGGAPPGTWKPDPAAFAAFARAVAARYSGSFQPDPVEPPLPAVRRFQAWNEPNLFNHLSPQYEGGKSFATDHYRAMLNAFYDAVHAVQPGAAVVTGGTAPYGEPPGGNRTRPLTFWRDVFCLRGRRLRPANCPQTPKLDVFAHHPINTTGGPRRSAFHPKDSSTPDFRHLRRIVRAAERKRQVLPAGRGRPLWATELWWESRPPDRCGVKARKHARWVAESLYLLWRQGASAVVWLSVRDQPNPGGGCGRTHLQAGLTFADGKRKPAFRAFRFPFVSDRTSRRKVRVWARAPAAGRLRVQRRTRRGWRRVAAKRVGAGHVFTKRVRLRGKPRLRARVGGEKSRSWRAR